MAQNNGGRHAADGKQAPEPDELGGGQISETSLMTPGAGADSIPGTDDGIPPADEAQQVAQGMPRDYTEGPQHRSGLEGSPEELGGAS